MQFSVSCCVLDIKDEKSIFNVEFYCNKAKRRSELNLRVEKSFVFYYGNPLWTIQQSLADNGSICQDLF